MQLAGLFGIGEVDAALRHAAVHSRFAEGGLAAIGGPPRHQPQTRGALGSEQACLTQGTLYLGREVPQNVALALVPGG